MAQANLVGAGAGPVGQQQQDNSAVYLERLMCKYNTYRSNVDSWGEIKSDKSYDIKNYKKKIQKEKERIREQYWNDAKKAEFYCSNGSLICRLNEEIRECKYEYEQADGYLRRDMPILVEIVNKINAIKALNKFRKELMARTQLHPYRIAECLETGDHKELDKYLGL